VSDLLSDGRRKYFPPKDVAEYLGISRSKVYALVNEGRIEAHRFGNTIRVSRDEILRYEKQSKVAF
jgi:excisionase family DNA binding protein